jgi:hypothetical protein
VYLGSFWDEPLHNDEQRRLFESEENDLYTQLACLPRSAAVRKLNDLIKRARLAKVHAFLIHHCRKKMPSMFGKGKTKNKLIANLPAVYQQIARERSLALGDFPDPSMMQEKLRTYDFTKFKKRDKKKMEALESMLSDDIPKLLQLMPGEIARIAETEVDGIISIDQKMSPFAVMKVGGATETSVYQSQWLVAPNPEDYREEFVAIGPNQEGRITGQKAKSKMVESKLPSNILHKIWMLADTDQDGALSLYEYALAMHFIKMRLDGQDLPSTLPPQMLSTETP